MSISRHTPRAVKIGSSYTLAQRTQWAKDLHKLITEYCLDTANADEAEDHYDQIKNFLDEKAIARPSVMLERSINRFTHFHDILHLPFVNKAPGEPDLKVAKAAAMFELLRDFCHAEAARNETLPENQRSALTWQAYAQMMTAANSDGYNTLLDAISSGQMELYNLVYNELTMLRDSGIMSHEEFAHQFIDRTSHNITTVLASIHTGNRELFDHVATEIFLLHRNHLLDDNTYGELFARTDGNPHTPIFRAVYSRNPDMFHAVATRVHALHDKGYITDAAYERQYNNTRRAGLTLLHETLFHGQPEVVEHFLLELETAIAANSETSDIARERFKAELMRRSDDNGNVIHCATNSNREWGTPNPKTLEILLETFRQTFGVEEARNKLSRLYEEETRSTHFRPAYHEYQPEWLRGILSYSPDDPLVPCHRLSEHSL